MKATVEHIFNGPTGSIAAYDPNKTLLGSKFNQYTGSDFADNYVSPQDVLTYEFYWGMGRYHQGARVYRWSDRYNWIFTAYNPSTTNNETFLTITLFIHDKQEHTLINKGSIYVNTKNIIPDANNKMMYSMQPFVYTHTTGTVSTSGASSTITGSGTGFTSERIAVGARIGFGTTDPTQVTTWYNITAINSDTELEISANVDISAGTPYVIEEIRILQMMVNSSNYAASALFLIKGLNFSDFIPLPGTPIEDSTNTDNQKALYKLVDSTTSNTLIWAGGIAANPSYTNTNHEVYISQYERLDTDTTTIYKLNIRAALTVSSGVSDSAFILKTGTIQLVGILSALYNIVWVNPNHGPGQGQGNLYMYTAGRLYRIDPANIVSGTTDPFSDFVTQVEMVPGGVNQYINVANRVAHVDYSPDADTFFVSFSQVGYIFGFKYMANSLANGFISFGQLGFNQFGLSATDSPQNVISQAGIYYTDFKDGYFYGVTTYTNVVGANILQVFPITPHWLFADDNDEFIITPKIPTLNATKYYRALVQNINTTAELPYQMYRSGIKVYYRTTGIDDNTGSWNLLNEPYDMSSVSPADYIQFKIKWTILNGVVAPTLLNSIGVSYEDGSQDYHYESSLTYSSAVNRQFSWRQAALWNSNIPNLRIQITNVANGFLVLDDDITQSANGTWEYTTDGITWNAWDNTQDAVGNYIRYTADSLPSNITVKALIREA